MRAGGWGDVGRRAGRGAPEGVSRETICLISVTICDILLLREYCFFPLSLLTAEGGGVMSWETITSLVGSLGFPIVCCIALFRQQNNTMKDFCDKITKSVETFTAAQQENTIAVESLKTTVQILYMREGGEESEGRIAVSEYSGRAK